MPSNRHPHFSCQPDPRPPATDPAEVARLRAEVAHVTRELAETTGDPCDRGAVRDWVTRWAMVLAIVLFTVACLWVAGWLGRLAR